MLGHGAPDLFGFAQGEQHRGGDRQAEQIDEERPPPAQVCQRPTGDQEDDPAVGHEAPLDAEEGGARAALEQVGDERDRGGHDAGHRQAQKGAARQDGGERVEKGARGARHGVEQGADDNHRSAPHPVGQEARQRAGDGDGEAGDSQDQPHQ